MNLKEKDLFAKKLDPYLLKKKTLEIIWMFQSRNSGDFPGGAVVKTHTSNKGGPG